MLRLSQTSLTAFAVSLLRRPLLYGIISHFLHGGKEESTQNTLPKATLLTYPKHNLGKTRVERNHKGGFHVTSAEVLSVTRLSVQHICF